MVSEFEVEVRLELFGTGMGALGSFINGVPLLVLPLSWLLLLLKPLLAVL